MDYLTVLNFSTGEVDIYPTEFDQEQQDNDVLSFLNHRESDCHWMYGKKVTLHSDIIKDGDIQRYLESNP